MILVLSLFLICVMVSSVILAAASAGVTRNAKRAEQQRGYLAVSSAADMIMEELKLIGTYTSTNVEGKYACEDCTIEGAIIHNNTRITGYRLNAEFLSNPKDEGHLFEKLETPHETYGNVTPGEDRMDGLFEEIFRRGCENVVRGNYTEEFTIDLEIPDARMATVTCIFTMYESYDVEIVVKTENSDYAVLISCEAESNMTDLEYSEEDDNAHTVYYKRYDASTGRYVDAEKSPWTLPIYVTTYDIEIQWSSIKVEKEVLSQ